MIMPNNLKWTPKEDAILKKLCDACVIDADIATVLVSRSIDAIQKRRTRLNLKNTPTPEIDQKKFKELIKEKPIGSNRT